MNDDVYYRRPPLASYICTEAIYGLFYSLKTKGYVKSAPNGEVSEAQVLNNLYICISLNFCDY